MFPAQHMPESHFSSDVVLTRSGCYSTQETLWECGENMSVYSLTQVLSTGPFAETVRNQWVHPADAAGPQS